MMPFFVKMKCRLMVPLTIFRSFEKDGEVSHNPHFPKHCDMENKFKSKICKRVLTGKFKPMTPKMFLLQG